LRGNQKTKGGVGNKAFKNTSQETRRLIQETEGRRPAQPGQKAKAPILCYPRPEHAGGKKVTTKKPSPGGAG